MICAFGCNQSVTMFMTMFHFTKNNSLFRGKNFLAMRRNRSAVTICTHEYLLLQDLAVAKMSGLHGLIHFEISGDFVF